MLTNQKLLFFYQDAFDKGIEEELKLIGVTQGIMSRRIQEM